MIKLIEVIFQDQAGNQLFQYCLGRILAERLGFALQVCPISGFPGTGLRVEGRSFDQPRILLEGHRLDLNGLLADPSPRRLVLRGWFQRYAYFQPYKQAIRRWLERPVASINQPHPRDLVVHVRRRDYLWHGWALPFSWYEQLIEQSRFRDLILVTDDPADPFFRRFRRYRPILRSQSAQEDFDFLRSARQLALSPSSFAWWAAFLGQAEWIGFPVPHAGIWAPDNLEGVDLQVWDEARYEMLPAAEMMRLNLAERFYFEKLFYRRKSYFQHMHRLRSNLLRLAGCKC